MAKTITGGVGRGGRNFPAVDVMTVQYLLNCVPVTQGGPSPELAVDGAAGPKTVAAIEKFQRSLGAFCDGRVDPGGATLRALQGRDPYPNQPIAQSGGKGGGGQPVGKGDPYGKGSGGNQGGYPAGKGDPFGKSGGGGKGGGYPPGGKSGGNPAGYPGGKGGGSMPGGGPFGGSTIFPGGKGGGGGGGGKGF